jgi:geranylgeranyl diphosphate synthase, type I
VAGQFLDILGEAAPASSVGQALRVVRLKIAHYTVVRPLQYGAALAGDAGGTASAAAAVSDSYARYGLAVGEAFQLRDDLRDAYGDPAVTGKAAGEDLVRGRPTVLLEMARSMASPAQRAELDRQLAAGGDTDAGRLAALVAETGAAAQVERMIRRRVGEAIAVVQTAAIHPAARIALADLAVVATRDPREGAG